MDVFKIKNSEGKFWIGHEVNKFTNTGRVWKRLSDARCSITNAKIRGVVPEYLKDCVIVQYRLELVNTLNICKDAK